MSTFEENITDFAIVSHHCLTYTLMAWISKKRYGCKWTWETIQHYTLTWIQVKERCCDCFWRTK